MKFPPIIIVEYNKIFYDIVQISRNLGLNRLKSENVNAYFLYFMKNDILSENPPKFKNKSSCM